LRQRGFDRGKAIARRLSKTRSELAGDGAANKFSATHGGFPAARRRFLSNPLEVFEAFGEVRQNVDRVLEGQGADLGKPAPDLSTKVERAWRQLMNQPEPSRGV